MKVTDHLKKEDYVVITAGNTGLIGHHLTQQLLASESIEHIYALSRRPLPFIDPRLEVIKHPELKVIEWDDDKPSPTLGFICLGTTIKQAGSKEALEHIDYHLVCAVAQEMKLLGVKCLAVVSCYGASASSLSHYLKCKGKMEAVIEKMGFEHVSFLQPGPLKGEREVTRKDEIFLQGVMKVLRPIMMGPLSNFVPIDGDEVARAMRYSIVEPSHQGVVRLTTKQMKRLIQKY